MEPPQPQKLRVAAVWGTTILNVRFLERGQSYRVGGADIPIPDDAQIPEIVLLASAAGWELDARGTKGGSVRLRGREENPVALSESGALVPIVPGDFGLLQYGLFSLFFQYTGAPDPLPVRVRPDPLVLLALFSSAIFHGGMFGILRTLMTPPPLSKPLELEAPDVLAKRLHVKTPEPELQRAADGEKGGGSPEKTAKQASASKAKGDEGKAAPKIRGNEKGEVALSNERPPLPGLGEVLSSDTGREIAATLQGIKSVRGALEGMDSGSLLGGTGMGLGTRGTGSGGGGTGSGFGSGSLDTGGLGGGGRGGGTGSGTGSGSGSGGGGTPTEAKIVSHAPSASKGGLTDAQIRAVVNARRGALRACYELFLANDPKLKGGVTVTWTIAPSGEVTSASIVQTSLNNARIEGCIQRSIKGWRFPASESSSQTTFPFKFGVGG